MRLLHFLRDALKVIGMWIIPYSIAVFAAFALYHAVKERNGIQDYGLGWAVIVLALIVLFSNVGFGRHLQRVINRHFGAAASHR